MRIAHPGRSRFLVLLIGLLSAVVSAACLDFERGIVLNKDLTGKASFKIGVDLEAFLPVIIQVQHEKEGKPGPATADELATLKTMVTAGIGALPEFFNSKALTAGLPAGVTVVESTQKTDGLKVTAAVTLAFTDVTKLPLVALPTSDTDPDKNPIKPFDDIEFKDEGATLLIATKADRTADSKGDVPTSSTDLLAQVKKAMDETGIAGLGATMGDALKGFKFRTRIESPLSVVDTNAQRREGSGVSWELTIESLDKPGGAAASDIKVRFKKS